ncbi:PAS domain S-box-containing protein [Rhodopseudomonas thermotolerans]|uniref:histidine kinase n=2 Tax=Rhodopseudomonas TaxID=1073 RepID=A0A336JUW5_9BRAD|nr:MULTISPECIES: PAS domain S-box protein [Rhodopseudomonas]RED31286.1 PAS domain S-box-containing protein [Rhodopseudomonas pentothenatexigens]REF92837.1 PAS domain S-box-containing protein [Rhodopseudomonas thermotolerans]SSW91939.1 PAS domain S-box-containing protein [Rhodopseudomonas pentothenatexigens]
MKLSTRLTLAMVALVLVTTAVLGFLNYQNVVDLVVPRALIRLHTHAQLNALLIESSLRSTHADAVGAQYSSAMRDLLTARRDSLRTTGQELPNWRKRIEDRFIAEMVAKPNCAILRVIGPDDGGRELVRVDRLGPNGSIRAVPAEELTRRGDRAYFKEGMALPPNQVVMSRVELNKTATGLETPHVPTVRTMAPIDAADGTRLGVLVINTDLRALLNRVRDSSDGSSIIYVVNSEGDYLLHPDRSREFGFDLGKRNRIQDDFPGIADLLIARYSDHVEPALVKDRNGERFGVGWDWIQLPQGPRLAVVEVRPYSSLTSVKTAVRNSTIVGGLVAVLVAMLMAIPLARSLTRPLVRITNSIETFASSGVPVEVKSGGGREIGVLAAAFTRMASESQRKAEALASEVEERSRIADVLQNTIDNMVDPVLVADARGMVILTNPAARELFGRLSGVGVLNTTRSFDRFDADGNPMSQDQSPLLRAYRGETIVNFEFAVQPIGSGRRSYLIANGRPLRSETGEIQGAVMVYHDITKTKTAEDALRRSEQMARAIIDTALDAFVQLDAEGRITDWSPHAEALLGWSRQEALGQELGELVLAPDRVSEAKTGYRRFIEAIEHDMGVIHGHRIEVEAQRRDGSLISLEVSMAALPVEGRFVVNAFMRDLTEKIAFEEQLRQSQKMESIGQLTGGIAHDFNNMLTVITGTIDIISDGVADQPHLAAIAKLISEAADRGSELTRLLLAFARKQPLRPDETEVNGLLAGLQSLLRPTLGEPIEVATVLAKDAWPIYVDRGQLESALVNLAVNARDAMPKGGKLTIETSNAVVDPDLGKRFGDLAPGDYVMIAITDTGCGIPEAIRSKVFDPFFTTKEVGKGTGLGLSMVYGFIKQSGGHITLDSEEGQGTTFRLYLPRARVESEVETEPATEQSAVGGTETILVVEDDAMVRSYVNAQLKSLGYTTLSVGNAAAALSIGQSDTSFDLLFTDVVMPGPMNGVQLAAEMAKLRPGLKVLYTSGYSENALIHNDRIDSDVLLLSKPYRRSDLARMIRRALASHEVETPRPSPAAEESAKAVKTASARPL